MSVRAVILGLLLGLLVSAATYFNDKVINQTMLIGNHLPISVFGIAVILLLGVNPLLRTLGRSWPLRGGEIAVIVAIGLASCGWPGSGYFRGFDTVAGLPQHWLKTRAAWQSTNVMSYVPGASANVAEGHVQDWGRLLGMLRGEGEPVGAAGGPDASSSAGEGSGPSPSAQDRRGGDVAAGEVVRSALSAESRLLLSRVDPGRLDGAARDRVLTAVNRDLIEPVGDQALWSRLSSAGQLPAEAATYASSARALRDEAVLMDAEATEAEAMARDAGREDEAQRAVRVREEAGYLLREAEHRERRANRAALAALLPGAVLPAPEGATILAASGRADPWAIDTLLQGRPTNDPWTVLELPWRAWVAPISLWWTLALLLGVSALCLTLIVHPQWSRRELLPYPIARFIEEAAEQKPGAWLPEVARTRMFWFAFVALVVLHSVNGLHAWFPDYGLPRIPLRLDMAGLNELFPNARRVWGIGAYTQPMLYPSVIAFAFFLTTSVSFSLGVSHMLFLALGAFLITQGSLMEREYAGAKAYNMVLFGAYAALGVMILYTGRRYYANVAGSVVGLARGKETPAYAMWAGRALLLTVVGAVVVMKQAGLDWFLAAAFVGLSLLIFVVMTRIVVETGAFFMQPTWLPVGVLTGLFGFEAIGPTAYIVLAIASIMNVVDPREVLMPYLANGLQMADRAAGVKPTRMAPWLLVMVVLGFFVAGVTTLYLQYDHGLSSVESWTKESLPTMGFDNLSRFLNETSAEGTLASATAVTPLERFARIEPLPSAVPWLLIGASLVFITAIARLRLPWWPLHPITFLVWGTYPMTQFAFSFLLGWIVKASVMRTTGAKGYHQVKPLMVGIIAGELFAGLLWIAVGAIYFWQTGKTPVRFNIFPA